MRIWRRPPGAQGGEKLRRLQAVTDAGLSGLQIDEVFAELLDRTRELLAVDTATILLVDEAGKDLVATAACGLEEEVRAGVRIPIGEGFAGRVAAQARPVTIDHVDHDTVINQILIDKQLKAMAGVPMFAPDRVVGVLHVGSLTPREFTEEDLELLRVVADRASLAAQSRLSQLDRSAALALQRSLLPTRPPAVDGLDVAARYIPGARVGVGGDWYDLFPLPSGHVGVVIGDVVGNGLRAAVVMGRFRSALRAYALETNDPADVLTRLDRKIQLFEPEAMATALYAVIDPSHNTMTVSVAGHLPPVLIEAAGSACTLDPPVDLPLGVHPDASRRATTLQLPPGSTLLLYTDGLIERRDRSLPDGIRALLNNTIPGDAEALCSRITARLILDEGPPTTLPSSQSTTPGRRDASSKVQPPQRPHWTQSNCDKPSDVASNSTARHTTRTVLPHQPPRAAPLRRLPRPERRKVGGSTPPLATLASSDCAVDRGRT